jgi:transposase
MGSNTSLARLFARAMRGERAVGKAPRNYDKNESVIGAMGLRGVIAVMSIEGAIDGLAFNEYVERVLLPELRKGDVVVMDNLNVHKASRVQQLIRSAGARLVYLPAYSPDFSPIENCWSKIKQYLRSCEARTRDRLREAIAEALKTVTAADIRGWFRGCGYGASLV